MNKKKTNEEKHVKGLAAMKMMNNMPDDLALCGSPETAPSREKNERENWFLRLMSSPVAAVVLSLCVSFAVVLVIIRTGGEQPVNRPAGTPTNGPAEAERTEDNILSIDFENYRFVIEGIRNAYGPEDEIRFTAYLINLGEPFSYKGYSFDFRPVLEISGNGMEPMRLDQAYDTDEKPKNHTVKTGDKSSAFYFSLPARHLCGAGTYTVTLEYNGTRAIFADVLFVSGEVSTQPAEKIVPVEKYFNDAWHCYDAGGVYFTVHTMDTPAGVGSYLPGMSVSFAAYLTNVSGPEALSADLDAFYPTEARVTGHGLDYTACPRGTEPAPDTSVSRLGPTGPLTWFDIPAGLLTEQGHYSVELIYKAADGELSAVIEYMILIEIEGMTERQWGDNPGLDGWTDMEFQFEDEIYAYETMNGYAVCFCVGSGGPEGASDCFGTRGRLIRPGTGWTAATSVRQLQEVIGRYDIDPDQIPEDERSAVEAALASFTDSFFETHDVLLFRYNTPSAGDRYVVTRMTMDASGTLRMTFRDENTAEEKVDLEGSFLAVIPIEKGVIPNMVYTSVSRTDTGTDE